MQTASSGFLLVFWTNDRPKSICLDEARDM
jgi:hypothetical protein